MESEKEKAVARVGWYLIYQDHTVQFNVHRIYANKLC
jgi:hypothetical protein